MVASQCITNALDPNAVRLGEVEPGLNWVFPCIGDGLGDCVGGGVRGKGGCIEEQVREQTVHVGAMHL